MGVMDRYNKKKREDSSEKAPSRVGVQQRYAWAQKNGGPFEVTQDTISSFISDANSYFDSAEEEYKGLGWGNASDVYSARSATASDLGFRSSMIRRWLDSQGSSLDEETYKSLLSTLDNIDLGVSDITGGFKSARDHYAKFDSEDAYNEAVRQREEYDAYFTADLDAIQAEVDGYQALLDEYQRLSNERARLVGDKKGGPKGDAKARIAEIDARLREIDAPTLRSSLSEKQAYLNTANRLRGWKALSDVSNPDSEYYDPEFEALSTGGADTPYTAFGEKTVHHGKGTAKASSIDKYRAAAVALYEHHGNATPEGYEKFSEIDKYRAMSDTEFATFAYYLEKDSRDGTNLAEQYIDSIEEGLNSLYAEERFKGLEDNWALELLFGVEAGLDQFASGMNSLFSDKDYIPTTSTQMLSQMVREDLGDSDFKILGSSIGQIGYDAITTTSNMLPSILASAAVNAVAPGAGAVVGATLLGASASGNAYAEMVNLGYDKGQARVYSALVGASEAGLQYILGGVGSLAGGPLKQLGAKALSKIDNALARVAISLGKEMVSEGLEEGLQTIIEPWLKSIVMHTDFDAPDIDEVLYSSLLGAISAAGFGGVSTIGGKVASTIEANDFAKAMFGGQEKALVGEAREIGTADTIGLADKYQSRLDKGKSLTGAQLRKLVDTNEQGYRTNDTTKIASAAEARLTEFGETGDVKALASILAKQAAGETLSRSEKATLDGSKYGKVVAEELSPEKIRSDEFAREWVQGIGTKRINADVYNLAREVAGATTEEDSASKPVAEKKYDVSESGKTTYGGKEVAIAEVADVKDGEVYLRLEGGETVKASDVEFATEDEALLYGLVATAGGSVDTAKELIGNFASANTNAKAYVGEALRAYQYGRVGIEKSLDNVELPEAVRKIAYNRGRIDAMDDAKQRPHHKVGEASTKRKINGIIYEGKGDSSLKKSPIQQGSIKAIETLAKLSPNIEFHVYRSEPKNGKRVAYIDGKIVENAPNGYFTEGNKIYIDLNAGNAGQGVMLYTASHEITHYIREWNAEGFKEFADFLFKHYGENGISIEKLITEQEKKIIARYKREGKAIPSASKLFDMAYEEVVADAMSSMLADPKAYEKLAELKKSNATLFEKIGEAIKKVLEKLKELLGVYKGYKVESQEAEYVSGFATEVYEQLQYLYLKAFVQADANVEAFADGATDLDGGESPHLMSDRSMIEGAGLQFIINENGSGYKVLDSDGNPVKSVTAEMIVDSPLGNLVTMAKDEGFLGKGREAETAANKQYKFLAELVNMCINYNGIAPIWETAGTMVFSSMKSNADKQYGLTIDFSTVCKKTQAIVDAMSEAMLRLGRGLNRSEVEAIYLEVGKAGESTPCPVCYVFSRWMGIGGILDQISQFQDKYTAMSEKSLKAFIADIQQRITERANTPDKSGKLKAEFFGKGGAIAEGKVITKLKEEANRKAASALNAIAKNSDTQLQIQELEALMENQSEKEAKKTARKIATLKKKLQDVSALEKQMREGNDTLEEYEAYQWLTRTMMMEQNGEWVKNPAFKPVPKDILFDLNKGDKFAEGYPLTWAFRTGKGAAAGKAIVPYADARVGEAIQSVAAGSPKDIKIGLELNPFFNADIKGRKRILRSAIEKQARQNLLGGQRYQSTSDFRYEYGSDYLITFLEMQAIGAKVQLYTKVIEAVDFLASMGCDCNLSVMPLSDGFVTLPDGTKKLVYSSVTGIDAEAAIKKSREYNNVQLILVGISDEHIRLALEGTDVTFVIPFHGSGNSVHQIQALMNLLGENLDVTTAQDYTAVQSDHVSPTQTKEQKAMWDLRLKVIKGEAATLSSAEQALLDKNPFLKDLHRRFYLDTNAEEFGVWLTSAQSEQIFPYEYWDKSLTYAEADRNGERFKEYCATMGIIPRFSGKNSKGESVGYGDFTNDKGYWKLLIDRPMYDNTYDADGNWTGYGKYHEQARINCSNFQVKHLDPEYGSATYGDVMSKENDPKKTNKIVDAALKQFENNEVNDVRLHSDRDSDGGKLEERDYTVSEIHDLFNRWNSDSELSALAEKVFAKLDSVILEQKEQGGRERSYLRQYATTPYEIRVRNADYIRKRAWVNRGVGVFSNKRSDGLYGITFDSDGLAALDTQTRAQVLLHEAIHAVTVKAIEDVEAVLPKDTLYTDFIAPSDWTDEQKGALALLQIYQQVGFSGYLGKKVHYGEESVYEMVAELSNPEFRQYLKTKSLWSRVIEAIKRILGLDTGNALDATSQALERILNAGMATSDPDIRYSLRDVDPVEPTTDKWQRTLTTSEVKKLFPNLWDVSADESEVRNPTQISGTVKSYRKVYDFLKKSGFKGTILDASSGLGYGTRAGIEEYGFDVEDIEPYPDKSYTPKYTDYSALDKQYNAIISNAVLNVLPQDQRDALVVKMGELLKVGGRMFINVRGDDVKSASSKVAINEELMEYYISKSGSYQKGFIKTELVAYLQDALGEGFTVMPTTFFGKASAVVTKNAEQKLYQERDTDSISSRTLLAEALESVAQNDIEKRKVAEYKAKIALIEKEQAKLSEIRAEIRELSFAKGPRDTERIKKLQFDEKQSANRVNTYDRQLLRLQSTEALRGVMEREKKMAYEKAKKEGKEALAAYREKTARTQRELLTKWQESRKRGIESRNKTEMRHKIRGIVDELNKLLLNPTKDKHVPIGLQKPVAEALEIINMDTIGAAERVAKHDALIAKAKDPDEIRRLTATRDRIQMQGENLEEKLKSLRVAYDEIVESDDPLVANAHDEVISERMKLVIQRVGSTPIREMTLEQLEDVYDMYKMVLTAVRNANRVFKAEKGETISFLAGKVMVEVEKVGGKKPYSHEVADRVDKFNWDNQKPIYAFERIGSSTLTRLYEGMRAGEDTWATDVSDARVYYLERHKKYRYDSWDFGERFKFTSTSGKGFELSLDQIMSLYAYSKRAQAADHLRKGGIVIDETTEVTVKTKLGIKMKFNPTQATAYNISDATLAAIIGKLTPEQRGFVDEMQDYLSTVMGDKGNEVSLELYGIKLFKDKNYFPLKSATQFMAKAKEQQQGEVKVKNKGMTQSTVPHASNPIVLTPFMDVWADHVNEMSMYHAFVLALENFYRVYNYRTPTSETMATESVEMFIQNAYGKGATQYIDQLLRDLNGGAISDPRETIGKALMSKFKKASVMASLSVVVQQPTAMIRAMALVDAKYFGIAPITRGVLRTFNAKKHKAKWAEVKKYAPVAIIKEMGYFDTNMGRSTKDFLMAKEYSGISEKAKALFTDGNYRDEVISRLPALADELAWVSIWEAVKRETIHKYKSLSPTSEEFLKKVGERFTEVVTKTQVYDSVLARSGLMRSKSTLVNMWTSFMGEPTTSLNMLQDALLKGKRGNKKYIAKAMGAVFGSVILNSVLVSLVYAMRDDDEDETYLEKYLARLSTEILDGINPLTYIPIVKDVWSIAQGFDVERTDMALVTDLLDSIKKTATVMAKDTEDMDEDEFKEHQRQVAEALWSIGDNIASLTGIPMKNLRREIKGFLNLGKTIAADSERETTAGSLMDEIWEDVHDSIPVVGWFPNESKADKLYDAIVSGDEAYRKRIEAGYASKEAYDNALRKIIRTKYEDGEISESEAESMLTKYAGKSKDEAASAVQYWDFKRDYPGYDLTESAVSKYYSDVEPYGISVEMYYDYTKLKAKCEGTDEDGDGETDRGSLKREVMRVIHSLPLTKRQKDALYYLNGWAESSIHEAPWR